MSSALIDLHLPAAPLPDDPLAALHDALSAAEQAVGLQARLGALLAGAQRLGLGAGAVVGHEGMAAVVLASASAPDAPASVPGPAPVPAGAVWRRWLRVLERRRATYGHGSLYALPLDDPWVRTEIGDPLCGGRGALPAGLLVAPLTGGDEKGERVLATLTLDVPGAWPPPLAVLRAVELLARYAARHIEQHHLAALAERRAERLQRLHEAGAALSRSLDEREIVRELARQVARLVPADGVVVAHPDVERGVVRTALRVVRGLACPRAEQPLGAGVIAAVARTGVGVRVDDYDPEREPLAAADDVVGDGGPAGSVLAVPMRVGTQLVGVVAVHAAAIRRYAPEDEELLRTVAAQAGTAIANARLYAESEAERRQSEALAEVARAVTGSLRLGEVLRLILRHTTGLLRAEGACIALRREDLLHVVAGVGSAELLAGVHVPATRSMLGRALVEGRAVISDDASNEPGAYRPLWGIAPVESVAIVPLHAADGPIGVLAAMNRAGGFGEADARVLQRLGDHVGVAVANARLFEEVTAATREWKAAFDAIAGGMVVLDEQGRIARCNARAAELLGAAGPKALLGAAFADALAAGDDAAGDPGTSLVRAAIEHGTTARGPVRSPARGRVYDVVAAPHPQGGAVVTFDDVTEHHALAERYRLVVETVRDAVVISDAEGRVTFANPAAVELFGRGQGLIGQRASALVRPEDAEEVERRDRLARDGEPQRHEVVVCRPGGVRRLVSVSTAPLRAAGQAAGVVTSMRDVTEERRLAGQLVQREKLAAVGRLVSAVAQELNNPLASVLALSEQLAGEEAGTVDDAPVPDAGTVPEAAREASEEAREIAGAVRAEARRAARIAARLLAFAGQRPPARAATDVNRVLLDALDLRRHALRGEGVDIDVDLDYEIPATWADAQQLQQVFVNLITNAEQALAAAAPAARRLGVWTRRDGDRVVAGVSDTGPGMSADEVARVFDPIYAATTGTGGGLGLSISDGIVREHGGRLRVETAPGAGATFSVELPLVAPPAADGD